MGKTRFQKVSFDSGAPDAGALIRIFRARGRIVATVVRYEWFEPDDHKFTGYADLVESSPAPAGEVLQQFRKHGAQVALESDELWDAAWGDLR